MDFKVSEEHEAIAEATRKIAQQYGNKYFVEEAKSGGHALDIWRSLADAGFIGANTPEEYGGAGQGIYELSLMVEEMAAAGSPALMAIISPAIVASILARHASEELKQRYLPRMASGEIVLAFAITEPDAGSNSHKITTTATKSDDGSSYTLSGTKYYISAADRAEAILVVARTGTRTTRDGKEVGTLSLLLVDKDAPGLKMTPIDTALGAPERQFMIFFDDVEVPASRLVGEENEGLKSVFTGLNPERIIVAAMACGLTRYFLEKSVDYAKQRSVWGQPIATHQAVAHPLARIAIGLEQAKLMTRKAAWLYDNGESDEEAGIAANMAKIAAASVAAEALDRAVQTHGGNGLAEEYGLVTLWGVTRLCRVAPISEEMGLNAVAQNYLGLPKSY